MTSNGKKHVSHLNECIHEINKYQSISTCHKILKFIYLNIPTIGPLSFGKYLFLVFKEIKL